MKRTFTTILSIALAASTLVATADQSFAKRRHINSRDYQCRQYANQQVRDHMDSGVGNGALLGAAGGGLYGGITGGGAGSNILTGVAAGLIGGAVLGGITHNANKGRVWRAAYADCMNNY